MKVKPIFAWYDLWIGLYWGAKKRRLYLFPIPCLGLVLEFKPKCPHRWKTVFECYQDRYYLDRCQDCGLERTGEL